MKKTVNTGMMLFEIIYPLFVYYFVTVLVMAIAKSYLGTGSASYMLCQTIVALVALPMMYFTFFRKDRQVFGPMYKGMFDARGKLRETSPKELTGELASALFLTFLVGTGVNNLICMSPLVEVSAGYAAANEDFFSSTLYIEILCSGILMPLLEELTFRGILYDRLRRHLGWKEAIVGSALLFGLVHFNLVQFVYAFLLGLFFGILLEGSGRMSATIAAHMLLNTLAVFRNECGVLQWTVDKSTAAICVSVAMLIIGLLGTYHWWQDRVNQSK